MQVLVPFATAIGLIIFFLSFRRDCERLRRILQILLGCVMLVAIMFCLLWRVEEWCYKQLYMKAFSECREVWVYAEEGDPSLGRRGPRRRRVIRREDSRFSMLIAGVRNGGVQSIPVPHLFPVVCFWARVPLALSEGHSKRMTLSFCTHSTTPGAGDGELLFDLRMRPRTPPLHALRKHYLSFYPDASFAMALLRP